MSVATPSTSSPFIGALTNSFAALPATFHARILPTPVAAPSLLRFNSALARAIGLDTRTLEPATLAELFSGNALPAGAEPVAMAYAGHQFGNFVPRLGDGRAILIGEIIGPDGVRRDLHLKGAGRTPFSRGGDGRAALGPVLREYLVSESMAALGVPTTRALAAVATGERILREGTVPGAIVTRVAQSHVRIGTFEFHAARGDQDAVRLLADYVIDRHYPQLREHPRPYLALLASVAARHARLVASWLRVGFVHGVMNTDNMSIVGETIDFGPCAFMDAWNPRAVYSAIDRGGRYAFANQPLIAQWNLARLAETLLPLIDADAERAAADATDVLVAFMQDFERLRATDLAAKIGIGRPAAGDTELAQALLDVAEAQEIDHTLLFWHLGTAAAGDTAAVRALFSAPAAFEAWAAAWRARLAQDAEPAEAVQARMRAVSPAIIPRNHQVERALRAAIDQGDLSPFGSLLEALAEPYGEAAARSDYAVPPRPEQRVLQTFCGT